MLILGIETSCDETALALVESVGEGNSARLIVRQNLVYSQVKEHEAFGGVVPEMAARLHMEKMQGLLKQLEIDGAPLDLSTIDLISVTAGPGLPPALRVGVEAAKALAWSLDVPVVGVSHMEGHIYANWLSEEGDAAGDSPEFPVLALLVSGGHTELVLMKDHGEFERLGETVDDAAGEAFDKVAHMLELPYPGGPQVAKLAESGNKEEFDFPRGMIDHKGYDFSFSGLKTAVLYALRENDDRMQEEGFKADIAASFQESVVDVLAKKTGRAIRDIQPKSLVIAGGVSANIELRKRMQSLADELDVELRIPIFKYTMDNAAMIAAAGYFRRGSAGRGEELKENSHLDFTNYGN